MARNMLKFALDPTLYTPWKTQMPNYGPVPTALAATAVAAPFAIAAGMGAGALGGAALPAVGAGVARAAIPAVAAGGRAALGVARAAIPAVGRTAARAGGAWLNAAKAHPFATAISAASGAYFGDNPRDRILGATMGALNAPFQVLDKGRRVAQYAPQFLSKLQGTRLGQWAPRLADAASRGLAHLKSNVVSGVRQAPANMALGAGVMAAGNRLFGLGASDGQAAGVGATGGFLNSALSTLAGPIGGDILSGAFTRYLARLGDSGGQSQR